MFLKRKSVLETAELTPFAEIWYKLKRNKAAMFALAVIIIIVIFAVFADVIANYDDAAITQRPEIRLQKPSATHWFGTDAFGRDLFARIIHGARYSLLFGVVCTLLSTLSACILGSVAAYFGR
ncbi:MAG: ABC transporter permease, partial [Eubacteriales bacterium]|nr:ABC transporter permease [Eubacteriales bacterium]